MGDPSSSSSSRSILELIPDTSGEAGNTAPVITLQILSSQMTAPGSASLEAVASDEDGLVTKVEFYSNNQLVGTDQVEPFEVDLSDLAEGEYRFLARVFDDRGAIISSDVLTATVMAPTGGEPGVDPCLTKNGYVPPNLSVPTGSRNISLRIGMRPYTPNGIEDDYERYPYNISGGNNPSIGLVNRNIDCDTNDNNLDVNCNDGGIRIEPEDDVECISGTAQVQITVSAVDIMGNECPGTATATVNVTYADACYPQQIVAASDPQTQGIFGSRVAIDGNRAVISAPGRGGNSKVGAAYIFEKSGGSWQQTALLVPSSANYTEINAVAIRGGVVAIASRATSLNGHTGRVYIYQGSGANWSLVKTVSGPSPTVNPNDVTRFGGDIAIDSNRNIYVGADMEDWVANSTPYQDAGAVYVYASSSNWNLSQRLTPNNPTAYLNFGRSLAVSGNQLVIGAPRKASEEANLGVGQAYLFTGAVGSWSQAVALSPSTRQGTSMQFGASVATDGNKILVGAEQSNESRGRAYLYSPNGGSWTEKALVAPDRALRDYFGRSVAMNSSRIVIGSPGARHNGAEVGASYIFTSQGDLTYKAISEAMERDDEQNLGGSVAISGLNLLLGSEARDSGNANNSGGAYFFTLP